MDIVPVDFMDPGNDPYYPEKRDGEETYPEVELTCKYYVSEHVKRVILENAY